MPSRTDKHPSEGSQAPAPEAARSKSIFPSYVRNPQPALRRHAHRIQRADLVEFLEDRPTTLTRQAAFG